MASPVFLLFNAFLLSLSLMKDFLLLCNADLTNGFIPLYLTEANFVLQKPYDVPLSDRYRYANGVHRMWVYSIDRPYKAGSPTGPRTEIRFNGYDYSSGIWHFEGYVFVPYGTSGASIMQIHRTNGEKPATDLMLMIFNGELRFYSGEVMESNIYNRWVKVNVIHDVDANKLTIFINGVIMLEVDGKGVSNFYFKCGVYAQRNGSYYMESRWRDIKIYKKKIYYGGGLDNIKN
ncbi:citrate-binding protein-like [Phalaenopsis equestris]|uniref:citrate-binding protein-like n=1 Tax=Phalaenopsis equestris TaxID=78828 RepID=UPI0009E5C2A7|nr:citrate-binding protein-like [Phalaenopsis equestris]